MAPTAKRIMEQVLAVRLGERVVLIPGSCYGCEGHVRLGFGPGTPAETIRLGLEHIDHFIADFKAGKVAA
ncbi:MAG TPA: hypothetical protein VEW91_01200 [bacterium]|nr:hypothetical protein [bacterium]